ncbi:TetR/AcrR family transcriptional regulator [Staphylococcus massiliensis]|uniref:TetR/AcrR family transcriptional regulator n=1 Tax=Staphylococcus massiliensis TaxID=555791 RepID=UPI00370D6B3E
MAEDRRKRKSKQAIEKAFLELLRTNTIESISIQQISKLADINRGTFYLHYVDKYDLLESLEDRYMSELKERVGVPNATLKNMGAENFSNFIIDTIIDFSEKHDAYYQAVLSTYNNTNFETKIEKIIHEILQIRLNNRTHIRGVPVSYFISYVFSSKMGLLNKWIKEGKQIPKSEIKRYLYELDKNGPVTLIFNEIEK